MPSLAISKHRRDRTAFAMLVAVAVFMLLLGVPLAKQSSQSAAAGASAPLKTFEQVDRNGDGWIERNEAVKLPGLAIVFERADANGDERLSKVEYAKGLAMLGGGR